MVNCNFIKKETLAHVFFCEFCEISKNTILHRTPLVAASENTLLKFITTEAGKLNSRCSLNLRVKKPLL